MLGKVRLKVILMIKHYAMKTHGVEAYLHAFLNSALDEGEWSASHFCRFIHDGKLSVLTEKEVECDQETIRMWWRGNYPGI
jgi:hypothetical protein